MSEQLAAPPHLQSPSLKGPATGRLPSQWGCQRSTPTETIALTTVPGAGEGDAVRFCRRCPSPQ
eukprot:15450449-Alexandrium_andersonii.AAC.1